MVNLIENVKPFLNTKKYEEAKISSDCANDNEIEKGVGLN